MLHNKPCCFQTFFFLCVYQGITWGLPGFFQSTCWFVFGTSTKQEPSEWRRSKCNSPKKNHEVSIPQNKARSVRWELSSCDYVYIIYIVDKKQLDFFALKKTGTSVWDLYTDKEVFQSEKK